MKFSVGQKVKHCVVEKNDLIELSDYVDIKKFGGELTIFEISDEPGDLMPYLVGYNYEYSVWMKASEIREI